MRERAETIYRRRYIALYAHGIPLMAYYAGRPLSFSLCAPLLLGTMAWYIIATFLLRRDDHFTLTAAAAAPFGLYLILAHVPTITQSWLIVAAFILVAVSAIILRNASPTAPRGKQYCMCKKLSDVIGVSSAIVGGCLTVAVLATIMVAFFPVDLFRMSTEYHCEGEIEAVSTQVRDDLLDQHEAELERLSEWDTLSEGDKLELMQLLCNIECIYYGIPHRVPVRFNLLPLDTVGTYDPESDEIKLNCYYVNHLPFAISLNSLLHECTHAYQHAMVDAYQATPEEYRNLVCLRDARVFQYEFAHYVGGDEDDDFNEYYSQKVERDAREVAEAVTQFYCDRLSLDYAEIVAD